MYVTYGNNNRTQMIRIPGPGRIEIRAIDGSANPYLAAAVLLAAGLDGIANELDPGEPNTENLYELSEADAPPAASSSCPPRCSTPSATSAGRRDACGARPGTARGYVDYFVKMKKARVQGVPRRGDAVGAQAVPDAVLGRPPPARATCSDGG